MNIMPKHQETSDPERLRVWLENNKDTDKVEIGGIIQPLVQTELAELQGYVPETDYNLALLHECSFGGGKSEIANFGARILLNNPFADDINIANIPTLTAKDDDGRLFRARLPKETLYRLQELGNHHRWNANQLATLVVRAYHSDNGIQINYQQWETRAIEKTGLTQEEIRKVCFARYRVEGMKKRYSLAQKGDPEAAMEKMVF